ncbi:MAG: 8-oxo-dGTP diphosphatase [Streptomyces sp.]|nr:8-oxo-dGTP diphosphatase [Streptomyces sp.]
MSSTHSGVILFHDGRLAVQDDYTLPAGPVPPGGDPATAAVEAARTVLGCEVRVEPEPNLEVRAVTGTHLYFRATTEDAGRARLLTREEAVHLPLTPWSASEATLRSWSGEPWWRGRLVVEEPYGRPPKRSRAGAVVIRDGRMLLIKYWDRAEDVYEVPGGGIEPGETPQDAVLRELAEETGLTGTIVREIAQVDRNAWGGSHPGHYFLVEAHGETGPRSSLDLGAEEAGLVWVPVTELPGLPMWPKRLAWRIAHWYRHGWPQTPAVLCDSLWDLSLPCDW